MIKFDEFPSSNILYREKVLMKREKKEKLFLRGQAFYERSFPHSWDGVTCCELSAPRQAGFGGL